MGTRFLVGVLDRWPAVEGTSYEGGRRIGPRKPTSCHRPLISIVTVSRNPGGSISKTFHSVKAQSYSNVEHIVIDGRSDDGTVEWLRANDKHIDYWISESDCGIYDAMNKGLMLAKGAIIGILNCGDEYFRDCCDIIRGKIPAERSGEAIVLCGAVERTDLERGLAFVLPATARRIRAGIERGMPVNHPSTFVTAETYRAVGNFDPSFRVCGDYDFVYRAFQDRRVQFEFIEEVLATMPMGGISEKLSMVSLRAREHYRIRKSRMGFAANIFSCVRLVAINGAKLFAKRYMSRAVLAFYYRSRHPKAGDPRIGRCIDKHTR